MKVWICVFMMAYLAISCRTEKSATTETLPTLTLIPFSITKTFDLVQLHGEQDTPWGTMVQSPDSGGPDIEVGVESIRDFSNNTNIPGAYFNGYRYARCCDGQIFGTYCHEGGIQFWAWPIQANGLDHVEMTPGDTATILFKLLCELYDGNGVADSSCLPVSVDSIFHVAGETSHLCYAVTHTEVQLLRTVFAMRLTCSLSGQIEILNSDPVIMEISASGYCQTDPNSQIVLP